MRTKTIYTVLLAMLSSCATIQEAVAPDEQENNLNSVITKSSFPNDDPSASDVHAVQSNPYLFLCEHVTMKNGTAVVTIGREDASLFGVPYEIYDWFIESIEEFNKKPTGNEE